MRLDHWIQKLLPKDDKFLALFEQSAVNLVEACKVLKNVLEAPSEEIRHQHAKTLKDIEHKGDEITHEIFKDLSTTFITPFDREDIGRLASSLDEILDLMDQAATCIVLYPINTFGDAVHFLADIIEKSVSELRRALPLLHNFRKNVEPLREACVRINAYENQAANVFHRAIARLFQEEMDPINLIKTKELLAMLESATDSCEDAAVLIENVLLKHA